MAWHIHTWAPRSKSVYYHFRAALRAKRPQQIKFSLPAHSLNPNPHENCQLKSKLAWHRIKPTHVLVGQDRTGQDRTGQDRTGQDRTGQDRTGQDTNYFVSQNTYAKNVVYTFVTHRTLICRNSLAIMMLETAGWETQAMRPEVNLVPRVFPLGEKKPW
jgi:hypothetical protein